MRIYAVMGLGYVGLELATALSIKNTVIGYDISERRIAELNQNVDSNKLIAKKKLTQSHVTYTNNLNDIKKANFYIIAVPTPAYFYEAPNLKPLLSAVKQLGPLLKKGDIIVFESTVYPGTTEEICIPLFEKLSKLKNGLDFHVGYSPERINPGDKKHVLKNIPKIVAAQNEKTLERVRETYSMICDTVHSVTCIQIAEAIKILENTQRDVNIALMNEFSKIMHASNLSMHEIIEGAKTKWSFIPFKPGLVGGHCISIDPHYIAFQAKRHGIQPDLILTARKVNDGMTQFIIQSMLKLLINHHIDTKDITIGVLGISYKENTNDIRNSLALKLLKELHEYGLNYRVHDPMEYINIQETHDVKLESLSSLRDLTVVILAVGHDYYRDIGLKEILKICKKPTVLIDVPNLFIDDSKQIKDLIYWSL